MSDPDPIVECRDVRKRFGAVEVLRGVDLTVRRGEFVALTGPSGGGKSTLLHLLAALDRPTSGQIVANGHDLAGLRAVNRYRRHDVGIVFQLHNLLPHMSAGRNVEVAMIGTGRSGRDRAERAAELLDALELTHVVDRSPTRLSGGERQRVAIARAIANDPAILLADEPTGSLDPESARIVLELLGELRSSRQMTIVMASHDSPAIDCADRELVLDEGVLVAPDQVRGRGPLVAAPTRPTREA